MALIKYTDQLKFDEEPDYDFYIKQLLGNLENLEGNSFSWVMDWSIVGPNWKKSLVKNTDYLQIMLNQIIK